LQLHTSMSFGERFLEEPDLFPARQSGEAWGSERVVIHFAGNDYVCDGLSVVQAEGLRAKFGNLCGAASDASPDVSRPSVTIQIFRVAPEDFIVDEREWEFDFDLDYSPTAVTFAGFHFMGRLDMGPPLRAALWTPEDERLVSHAIFENVLRVVVAYDLLEQGGVLLHSAAVVGDTGAHVFFGPSGAGKSTISRLSLEAGCAVLSDDMNALRITAAGVVVEKLPFAGDLGQTMETDDGIHPVRNLCRLERGGAAALRPVRAAPAVALLLECAPFVNRNPYKHDQLIEQLEALNSRIPVRVLTFAIDSRFLPLLEIREPG
jgi:hypothetical protein